MSDTNDDWATREIARLRVALATTVSRTKAERAVLDAMRDAVIRTTDHAGPMLGPGDEEAVCRAELARRDAVTPRIDGTTIEKP